MGVLLDSTFLIDAERRGLSVTQTLLEVEALVPAQDCGISVVSVMEMAHGEARAASNARTSIRALFRRPHGRSAGPSGNCGNRSSSRQARWISDEAR